MHPFLATAKKTVWVVNEKDFEGLLKPGFNYALQYFLLLLIVGSIPLSIFGFLTVGIIGSFFSIALVMGPYILGVGILLPLASHFLIRFFGGKRPLTDTFQLYFYAATPSILFQFVPILQYAGGLVGFGNVFRGLRELNKLSFWKTAVAVFLPSLLYWVPMTFLIAGLLMWMGRQ